MSDQATKLRSIIDQKMKVNSEPKESIESDPESLFVSDVITDSETLHMDNQLKSEEQMDARNHEVLEKELPSGRDVKTSAVDSEQNQNLPLEKKREIGILAIASNHLMTYKAPFILKMAIQLQGLGKNVCIIDVDGGLFSYLDQDNHERPTLTDVINQKSSLLEAMITGPQQIKMIQSGDFVFNNPPTEEMLRQQLEPLSKIDFLLINTGTDLSRATTISFLLAQELVLISKSDVTAIKETYSFLKLINSYQIQSVVRVIFERMTNIEETQRGSRLLMELIEQFLDIKMTSLGYVDSKMLSSSGGEQLQSQEEFEVVANKLKQLSLLGGQHTTMEEIINKLIQLCS